jgi:homoserine kinase
MIDGRLIKHDGKLQLFDTSDDAARKHDEILQAESKDPSAKLELNFRPDGTRMLYEDVSPTASSGLGGSAASVVPALSVINIKVSGDHTSRAPLFLVDCYLNANNLSVRNFNRTCRRT